MRQYSTPNDDEMDRLATGALKAKGGREKTERLEERL